MAEVTVPAVGEADTQSLPSSAVPENGAIVPQATALQDLIAGGVAGSASVIVGHPFDTYKVRLQTSKPGCTESTRAFGGLSSLFRGMGAPLSCAAVVNAIIFSAFGESSRLWDEKVEHRKLDASAVGGLPHDSFTKSFVCGSFAGFAQSFIICPMEHVKCRLQVQHGAGSADALYRGPFDAIHKILSGHGIRGLFRGMGVTLWRETPAFGLYFSTYDTIKDWGNKLFEDEDGEVKDWHAWGASAFAGGMSGCLTWLVIYPFDIMKTRIQTAPWNTPRSELKMMNVYKSIIREHGWRFMFRGLGVTLVRAFPVNATIFPVYEFTLNHLVSSGFGGRD